MKRFTQIAAVAAMASLFGAGALAGTHSSANAEDAGAEKEASHATQEQTMWKRGQVLDLIQEEMTDDAASSKPTRKQTWDRGHILRLIEEQDVDQPGVELGQTTARVVIYFDSTASEPGLPRSLGNTNAGRSIMLKYLEQARNNAPSS